MLLGTSIEDLEADEGWSLDEGGGGGGPVYTELIDNDGSSSDTAPTSRAPPVAGPPAGHGRVANAQRHPHLLRKRHGHGVADGGGGREEGAEEEETEGEGEGEDGDGEEDEGEDESTVRERYRDGASGRRKGGRGARPSIRGSEMNRRPPMEPPLLPGSHKMEREMPPLRSSFAMQAPPPVGARHARRKGVDRAAAEQRAASPTVESFESAPDGWGARFWGKRREVVKLLVIALVVVLALGIHSSVMHYIGLAVQSVRQEGTRLHLAGYGELVLRLLYPLIVLVVIWVLKVSNQSQYGSVSQ